eukprot:NODE_1373_length_1563_cov_23.384412_g1235_i0.p2 GENE.NODE_1373_length_1563_cov_23.384412_g1235_i0~~NODE_1373_length_1563_cov_23.384412_g1235_i0.p2  ORF type:complete len:185 (+),score=34.38 NODE_1373_length_1563_cov_23.384412_g1235_i0:121-675(+)
MRPLSALNTTKAGAIRTALQSGVEQTPEGLRRVAPGIVNSTLTLPSEAEVGPPMEAVLGAVRPFVDENVQTELQTKSRTINWHPHCSRVVPIQTLADHNCLCHGVSIAIWGTHDRALTLRQAIADTLSGNTAVAAAFRAAWRTSILLRDSSPPPPPPPPPRLPPPPPPPSLLHRLTVTLLFRTC